MSKSDLFQNHYYLIFNSACLLRHSKQFPSHICLPKYTQVGAEGGRAGCGGVTKFHSFSMEFGTEGKTLRELGALQL